MAADTGKGGRAAGGALAGGHGPASGDITGFHYTRHGSLRRQAKVRALGWTFGAVGDIISWQTVSTGCESRRPSNQFDLPNAFLFRRIRTPLRRAECIDLDGLACCSWERLQTRAIGPVLFGKRETMEPHARSRPGIEFIKGTDIHVYWTFRGWPRCQTRCARGITGHALPGRAVRRSAMADLRAAGDREVCNQSGSDRGYAARLRELSLLPQPGNAGSVGGPGRRRITTTRDTGEWAPRW